MTDEQPDQPEADRPNPFMPPTLPLPTEPLAGFGVRATAEVPEPAVPPVPSGRAAVPEPPPAQPTVRMRPPDPTGIAPTRLQPVEGAAAGTPPMPSVGRAAATAPTPPMPPVTPPAPPRLRLPSAAPAPVRIGAGGPVLVQLGEVAVTATTIITPAGEIPLRGSQWTVNDQFHSRQRIPAWAVVCAILLFFLLCFLSLLFLLVKETTYEGSVQISIANAGQHYVVRIPVGDQRVIAHLHAQVNYVRSLAAL
ncbi:hypothetical protein QEZ54_25655 [Catellatospora sp. KI3]|uniref:hypothetical protein n=1 Tax=Catellatospora sp. KI3 TaxID=3041620 RepID=UPI0024831F58|nr:hypothetical protein [Catellatospora sp. KI3]MDI1464362.1 hypothetical protein [Catellatospora sp. KI3]